MIAKKFILWTFLAFVILAMLTGIAAVVLPSGWVDDKVMITIFIVGCYALGGLVVVVLGGTKGTDGRKQRRTLHLATAALFISLGLFITGIWVGWRLDDYFLRPGAVALTLGIALVHRLMVRPLACDLTSFKLSKPTALTSGAITASITAFGFINDGFGNYDELMVRVLAIAAIITAGTTVFAGALAFFAPKPGDDEQGTFAGSIEIPISCPRCHTSIKAQSNKDARCPSCKLKVRIDIEEPRCACGYLLYQLNSDTCPECGKAVPESEQWGSAASGSSAAQSASVDHDQTPSS